MPEAFSSIADMRIVIDAATDKLDAGMIAAQNIVKRFASEASENLSLFDRAVGKIGGEFEGLQGKATTLLQTLTKFGNELAVARQVGSWLAERTGKTEEWNAFWAAIDDVQAAFTGLATGGSVEASEEAIKAYALAADHATNANQLLIGSFSDWQHANLWGNIRALGEMAQTLRTLSDPSTWSTQTIDNQFDRLTLNLNQEVDAIRKTFSTGQPLLNQLLGTDAVTEEMEQIAKILDGIGDLNTRRRDRVFQDAQTAEGPSQEEFDKVVPSVVNEVTAIQQKAAAYGLTAGEAAAYASVMKVVNDLQAKGLLLTEDAAEKLGELTDQIIAGTDAEGERNKARASSEASKKFIDGLQDEVRGLQQQSATTGMSASETAAYNAEMRIRNQLTDQSIVLTAEQRAEMEKAIVTIRTGVTAQKERSAVATEDRAAQNAINSLERDVANEQLRAAAIGQSTAATAAQAAAERALLTIRQSGREATPQQIKEINDLRDARQAATQAAVEAQDQVKMVNDIGGVFNSDIDAQLRKWAEGADFTKQSFKDMARSILSDLAEIALKAAIVTPLGNLLTGSSAGGGGIIGQVLNSFGGPSSTFSGVIPGFADGGDFPAGGPMLVGERGPEILFPKNPGTIIPNHALSAASSPASMSMTVNNVFNVENGTPEGVAKMQTDILPVIKSTAQNALIEMFDRHPRFNRTGI